MTPPPRASATPDPRAVLPVALLLALGVLVGACSTTPRRRAASRAVKEMVEDLQSKSSAYHGAQTGERGPLRVTFPQSGDLETDVAWAINKHADHLRIVASGEEAKQQSQLVQMSTGDEYADTDWDRVGSRQAPEFEINAVLTEQEDGELEVRVKASEIYSGVLEGQGIGSSVGTAERAKSWGVTGAKVLATPFLVILDIGATSVDYAFKDEKKPGFVSTVSRGLLAIVYSPVAIFTSKYPKTRNWFSDDEE